MIEHWRDGELIETIPITQEMVRWEGGTVCITFAAGLIELATRDELRIDVASLLDDLHNNSPYDRT